MAKLVCDRCGMEITGREYVEQILAGMEAWQESVRARGDEPRGIFPCKHYIRCGGELQIVKE
jgi:hypothetical protein